MEAEALGALRGGEEVERPVIDAVPLTKQLVLRSRDASAVSRLRAGNRSAESQAGAGRQGGRGRTVVPVVSTLHGPAAVTSQRSPSGSG